MTERRDCSQDIGHGPTQPGGTSGPADAGGQYLAAALRTSFRLLGAIMVLGVLAFFAMGVEFVQPGEVAIRTVFGRVAGTTPKGLAYNWPSPIGRIETIRVGERTVDVGDFWLHETPEDRLKDLRKRTPPRGGLRPAWDGALLTGDRNLLHVRLKCTYAIRRQWDAAREGDPVLLYRLNVRDPNETMRSVLCDAAIRAAASRTADALQRADRSAFEADMARLAQARLDDLQTGLAVRTVKVEQSSWPLATLPDYDAAQRAVADADAARSAAIRDAVTVLNAAAGPLAADRLVGGMAQLADSGRASAARPGGAAADTVGEGSGQAGEAPLLAQYAEAVRSRDQAAASQRLAAIDEVLLSHTTGGLASRLIAEARGYRTAAIETVKRRAQRFAELLPEYRKAPQFMVQRLWQETREAILASPTVEKHYIHTGQGTTVLRLDRDPKIVRDIQGELLKKAQAGPVTQPAMP